MFPLTDSQLMWCDCYTQGKTMHLMLWWQTVLINPLENLFRCFSRCAGFLVFFFSTSSYKKKFSMLGCLWTNWKAESLGDWHCCQHSNVESKKIKSLRSQEEPKGVQWGKRMYGWRARFAFLHCGHCLHHFFEINYIAAQAEPTLGLGWVQAHA